MRLTREFFVPSKFKEKIVKFDGAVEVYIMEDGPKYVAKGFKGKAAKSAFYYNFKTAERMNAYVEKFFADYERALEYKAERKAEVKAAKSKAAEEIKVGDIYSSSWGYDQTNVDFYKVLEVKKASAVIVKVGSETVSDRGSCTDVVAVPEVETGEPMLKRIGEYGFKVRSFAHATKWDGKPKYATGWGYGH